MEETTPVKGPVIIGGVGGSGTRVVAEIISLFGFYLGNDLNSASDNLTYTLLFKRPEWFRKNFPRSRRFNTGFGIMEKAILTGKPFTFREKWFIRKAVHDMSKHGHNREGQGKGDWPLQRLEKINARTPLDPARYCGWGWKEPNSHLALEGIRDYFPDFKYIHTIRHGLDMAYSSNQQQLHNWAPLFNTNIPEGQGELPAASFRYWAEANRRVVDIGSRLGEQKFLLVNYDELCKNPLPGIIDLAKFLGVDPDESSIEKAVRLPRVPESAGRYLNHPGFVITEEDKLFLEAMGFGV